MQGILLKNPLGDAGYALPAKNIRKHQIPGVYLELAGEMVFADDTSKGIILSHYFLCLSIFVFDYVYTILHRRNPMSLDIINSDYLVVILTCN